MDETSQLSCCIDLWKKIHHESNWDSDSCFPSANAQAFVRHHLPSAGKKLRASLLDLGCGSGGNSVFFAERGCKVYGVDVSPDALSKAEARAKLARVEIELKEGDFTKLPFQPNFFDAVFSEGVLYYGTSKDFESGVEEIYRVLKPDGVARIYTKSDRDAWAKDGKPLGADTFLVDTDHYEHGLKIYCPPIDVIKRVFSSFARVRIGIEEFNYIALEKLHSFWVITCEK